MSNNEGTNTRLIFGELTVIKLKEELAKHGLIKTGLKPTLIERLVNKDAQAGQEAPSASKVLLEPSSEPLSGPFQLITRCSFCQRPHSIRTVDDEVT